MQRRFRGSRSGQRHDSAWLLTTLLLMALLGVALVNEPETGAAARGDGLHEAGFEPAASRRADALDTDDPADAGEIRRGGEP